MILILEDLQREFDTIDGDSFPALVCRYNGCFGTSENFTFAKHELEEMIDELIDFKVKLDAIHNT